MSNLNLSSLGFRSGTQLPNSTAWREIGAGRNFAIVLSCPGYDEFKAQRPAAGPTGVNLAKLLMHLRSALTTRPSASIQAEDLYRGEITITNASNVIHYKREIQEEGNHVNTRSEPLTSVVKKPANAERLFEELSAYHFVLPLGAKARAATDAVIAHGAPSWTIVKGKFPHLSGRGLNTISGSGTEAKLQHLAVMIADSLAKEVSLPPVMFG